MSLLLLTLYVSSICIVYFHNIVSQIKNNNILIPWQLHVKNIFGIYRQNILIFNKQSRNPFRFIDSRRWCGGYNFPVHYHLSILDNNHHDSTVAARHVYYQTTKFYCALFLQSHGRVPTVAG